MWSNEKMLTAKDLQRIFSMGKNKANELMNSSGFPTIKIGGRKYVTEQALDDWIKLYQGREYKL